MDIIWVTMWWRDANVSGWIGEFSIPRKSTHRKGRKHLWNVFHPFTKCWRKENHTPKQYDFTLIYPPPSPAQNKWMKIQSHRKFLKQWYHTKHTPRWEEMVETKACWRIGLDFFRSLLETIWKESKFPSKRIPQRTFAQKKTCRPKLVSEFRGEFSWVFSRRPYFFLGSG